MSALARAVVGLVLLASGGSKAVSPAWPRQAAVLGAPSWAVIIVPAVELSLGALLVLGAGEPITILLAAAIFIGFSVVLAQHLARGERPPCACFGFVGRPISWWSVARNAVLVALCVVALLNI